jgi:hypothetical protein
MLDEVFPDEHQDNAEHEENQVLEQCLLSQFYSDG